MAAQAGTGLVEQAQLKSLLCCLELEQVTLSQVFQHAHLALRLDQRGLLLGQQDLQALQPSGNSLQFMTERLLELAGNPQSIDVEAATRRGMPAVARLTDYFVRHMIVLLAQALLGGQRLGQFRSSRIALGLSQAQQPLQAKLKTRHGSIL
jgi:hypothetical protein